MTRRSYDDIDRAVSLGRRALAAQHLSGPEPLTRFLHQRWYLGRGPSLAAPSPRTRPQAGPWRTWNRAWEHRDCGGAELVRLYLSCAPQTSLHVVGAIATHLQDLEQPWLLSCRAMGQAVPTPDATVLYLPLRALPELRNPLMRLVDEVQPLLASTVPAMTLPIARGAALAQNPADGRPFGEHRCALLAGAVIANRQRSQRATVEAAMAALRKAGIDPQAPYRAVGASWSWDRRPVAAAL